MATLTLPSGANINNALASLSGGGNIVNLGAGSYSAFGLQNGPNGTSGNPNIIRAAAGAAVLEFSGDTLTNFRTSGHVTITGRVDLGTEAAPRHHWIVEGLRIPNSEKFGTNASRGSNIEVRRCEIGRSVAYFGQRHCIRVTGLNNFHLHHCIIDDRHTTTVHIDYGVDLICTDDALVENNMFRGRFHQACSLKRNNKRACIRHNLLTCGSHGFVIGQNYDDSNSLGDGTTVLAGASNTRSHKTIDCCVEFNFATSYFDATGGTRTPTLPFSVGNARNAVIRYNFIQRYLYGAIQIGEVGVQQNTETGVAPPLYQNVDVYGNTIVHGIGSGHSIAFLKPSWLVILARSTPADNLRVWNNTGFQSQAAAVIGAQNRPQSSSAHPWAATRTLSETKTRFINNNICNYGVGGFQYLTGALPHAIDEEGNNNWFNAGSRGKTGDISQNPLFRGSTAEPGHITGLPSVWNLKGYLDQYAGSDRWMYQAGSPLLTAGRPAPTTDILGNPTVWQGGPVAIGSHQALEAMLGGTAAPPREWVDAGVFAADAPLWRADVTPPWVAGRGLVVRVSTGLRRLVVGIGSDPLDPTGFADNVWIHKAAFLQLKRNKVAIELQAGTTGAEEDDSGAAWRTRAVYDWTEPAEHVVGFWVRYEIAPALHRVAATTAWAWQGVQR
jgi:hypothetical protein